MDLDVNLDVDFDGDGDGDLDAHPLTPRSPIHERAAKSTLPFMSMFTSPTTSR